MVRFEQMGLETKRQTEMKASDLGAAENDLWPGVIKAGVRAQQLVPGAVCVGGTAAAIYAKHRISLDTDHVLTGLREHFDEVRSALEARSEWKTARVQPPVLILGSIDGIEVGFRQQRRNAPVETTTVETPVGPLVIPTLDEIICMKAFLAYNRNTTRDFIDLAALSECSTQAAVIESLRKLDIRYKEVQSTSVCLGVAKALALCAPYDLVETELPKYKALSPKWHSWETTQRICQNLGEMLAASVIE